MALLLVALHLAVPWVLRRSAGLDRPRGLARAVRGRVDAVYGHVTIGLAALALVLGGSDHPDLFPPAFWLGLAVVVGTGLPLLVAALAGRPRRFARLPGSVPRTVLCAAAEEVLWRLTAIGVLVHAGLAVPVASALALAGFAVLHAPRFGWRALPYQVLFGAVLTSFALFGGVLAAALCHASHNLVLAATARRRRGRRSVRPGALPPSRAWHT